jgi:hypothetical protein
MLKWALSACRGSNVHSWFEAHRDRRFALRQLQLRETIAGSCHAQHATTASGGRP